MDRLLLDAEHSTVQVLEIVLPTLEAGDQNRLAKGGRWRQVEKLTLEAEHLADPSVAPRDQATLAKATWKPNPVAMWLPAATSPTKASALPMCRGRHALQSMLCNAVTKEVAN